MEVSERIRSVIETDPDANIMEWRGKWWKRSAFAKFAKALSAELARLGVEKDMAVAAAMRNRPNHCFAMLTLLAEERPVSALYAYQAAESLARDIVNTSFAVLIADEDEWTPTLAEAAKQTGTPAIILGALPEDGFRTVEPSRRGDLGKVLRQPSSGVEILSSGTTGLPKRIFHPAERLFRSLRGMLPKPQTEPDVVFWAMGGIGGTLNLVTAMWRGVPFVLLEKFTAEGMADAIKRHNLSAVSLTPTMVRMMYDANIMPEDVPSLKAISGGSGALDPELQDKMEERFGFPIIWQMGATEFCGTIISWSHDLRKQFPTEKRGSTGKVLPGCQVRIVDPETDVDLPAGSVGQMLVQADAVGPEWIRTTDLAMVDEDGFVFMKGRADNAINRGGFKIVPEKVCETLRMHPDVGEAAVVGFPDDRLGEVPVAMVEARPGTHPSADELEKHLRGHLASPQIPVRFFVVEKLPYTASTKVHIAEVRRLVAERMKEG